jgi:hypothetical protein
MLRNLKRKSVNATLAIASGTTLILGGCDPTLQATVENGIINVSTSFLTALLQAITQVYTTDA